MPGVLRDTGRRAPFRPGLLPSGEGADGAEASPEHVFPEVALDDWREGLFQLLWRQHGGSGLGVTEEGAMEMSVGDRDWFVRRVRRQREREATEIEKAAKGK